jgi:hypothetical protein
MVSCGDPPALAQIAWAGLNYQEPVDGRRLAEGIADGQRKTARGSATLEGNL